MPRLLVLEEGRKEERRGEEWNKEVREKKGDGERIITEIMLFCERVATSPSFTSSRVSSSMTLRT